MAIQFDEVVASAPPSRSTGGPAAAPVAPELPNLRRIEQELRRLRARQARLSAT